MLWGVFMLMTILVAPADELALAKTLSFLSSKCVLQYVQRLVFCSIFAIRGCPHLRHLTTMCETIVGSHKSMAPIYLSMGIGWLRGT